MTTDAADSQVTSGDDAASVAPAEGRERAAFARAELAEREEKTTDRPAADDAASGPPPSPLDPQKSRAAVSEIGKLLARIAARFLAPRFPGTASQLVRRAGILGDRAANRWGERLGCAFPFAIDVAGEIAGFVNATMDDAIANAAHDVTPARTAPITTIHAGREL